MNGTGVRARANFQLPKLEQAISPLYIRRTPPTSDSRFTRAATMILFASVCLLVMKAEAMNLQALSLDFNDYAYTEVDDMLKSNTKENESISQADEPSSFNENMLPKEILGDQNGTDSGMYNEDLFEGDILLDDPEGKNAVANWNKLWPNGVIIYKISDDVGCPHSRQCKIIMYAMEIYHRKTCVRFKEWTGEKDYVEIFYNSDNSGACWSAVGRSGGQQRLSLGFRCWYLGIAVHELGHAVGFWHEMNRPDRDEHIIIHWRNILPGFASSFIKNSASAVNTLGELFDLKSIMMYDEYAFSKDGISPTIQTKSGTTIGPIWKKRGLSESDIRRVHKLYKCNGSKMHKGFPHNFKCDFSVNTCGFRNRGKTLWKWRAVPRSGGYIFCTGNQTSLNTQLISVNFHPFEGESSNSSGCFSFSYFLSGASAIQAKQEILYAATDVSRGFTRNLWHSDIRKEGWNNVQTSIDLRKPYRIVFDPVFNSNGVVAINNVKISTRKCNDRNNREENEE